jgi:hypothetical protein
MKKMESRYAGKCRACGGRFAAGTLIEYDRTGARGRKAQHVDCDAPQNGRGDAIEGYGEFGSTEWNNRPTIEFRTASGTFYQRAGGRCEDAPCCGCCTS